jgi:hypothetical protein
MHSGVEAGANALFDAHATATLDAPGDDLDVAIQQSLMDTTASEGADSVVAAAVEAAAARDSAQYDEAVSHVSDITGCDALEARHLLEVS